MRALRDTTDLESLERHLPQLLQLVGQLLHSDSFKVTLNALEVYGLLAERLQLRLSPALRQVVDALVTQLGSGRLVVRTECYRSCRRLMRQLGAEPVVTLLRGHLKHPDASVREHVLNVIIYALLTFPASAFNVARLAEHVAPTLTDEKRRVRQAALECVALLAQLAAPAGSGQLAELWQRLEKDGHAGLRAAVSVRLQRKQLPRLTEDGLVEYSLQLPSPNGRHSSLQRLPSGASCMRPPIATRLRRGQG